MATRYWVVSLPVQGSASAVWNNLQDQISKHSFDTPIYRVTSNPNLICSPRSDFVQCLNSFSFSISIFSSQFNIPNLRVGTLDSLLSLSDDLLKVLPFYSNL